MSVHTISTPILPPSTPIKPITKADTETLSLEQLLRGDVFDNTSDVVDLPKVTPAPEPVTEQEIEPFSMEQLLQVFPWDNPSTSDTPPSITLPPSNDKDRIDELFRALDAELQSDDDDELPPPVTTSLPKATAFTLKPDYKPVSFDTLFPADLKELHFKQQDIGDCYLLAALDSLFHHPDGAAWLQKIKFEAAEDTDKKITKYKVTFPTGFSAEFDADEVGKPKSGKRPVEGPLGVQLLELAFAKSTLPFRNAARLSPFEHGGVGNTVHILEGGTPYEALHYMFRGAPVSLSAIPATPLPSGITIAPTDPFSLNPNGLKTLKDMLRQIEDDKAHTTLISANTPTKLGTEGGIRITLDNGTKQTLYRDHTYSIRGFNLDNETITIANPHDTKTRVATLSFKEFIQAFNFVNGVKLAK